MSTIFCQIPSRSDRGLHELQKLHRQLEETQGLLEPEQLELRLNALDDLEAMIGDLESNPQAISPDRELVALARAIRRDLEGANEKLFEAARAEIVFEGRSRLVERWLVRRADDAALERPLPGLSYDPLDEIVSGVLQLRRPREALLLASREMTAYQPTPARHILDLAATCNFSQDDVLIDLGSGLGHVPLLVCILKGIRVIGVEVQPDHAASAQEAAESLNLTRARFVAEDARRADFSGGTVFYMFTPFRGSILRDVLHRLREESRRRQIKICALGPCTRMLEGQAWLAPIERPDTERITTFESQ